jgi:hypothetical protein
VTVNVATTGRALALTAVKVGIFPDPLAGMPIDGVLFVQEYDVPVPVKLVAGANAPLQTTASNGSVIPGVGFTVMENV